MRPSKKDSIIDRFWEGETSIEEEKKLFKGDHAAEATDADNAYFRFVNAGQNMNDEREDELWNGFLAHNHKKKRLIFVSISTAASFLLIVSLLIFNMKPFRNNDFIGAISPSEMDAYHNTFMNDDGAITLYINGCKSSDDCHTVLQNISPQCIRQINLTEANTSSTKKTEGSKIEVWLKGETEKLFSVCEGTLFFYQDGEMKSISIDDECSPNLLVDCREMPLSEIAQLQPDEIESIELTSDPINCTGQHDGEFIVLESK